MKKRTWRYATIVAIAVLAPGAALAQGTCAQPAVVKVSKEQGDRAMDAARPADGLTAYQQAPTTDPVLHPDGSRFYSREEETCPRFRFHAREEET